MRLIKTILDGDRYSHLQVWPTIREQIEDQIPKRHVNSIFSNRHSVLGPIHRVFFEGNKLKVDFTCTNKLRDGMRDIIIAEKTGYLSIDSCLLDEDWTIARIFVDTRILNIEVEVDQDHIET